MMKKIPLSSPDITDFERKAVMDVLRTQTLSLGPKLNEFEERFAKFAKRKYAVAVNSGTSALHLIVRALGIGKGDEVITTPFSFIASSNCILYEGAKPVFADIDEETLNIDIKKIEGKITKRTKAILAVDVFGNPADWDALLRIAKKHKLKVIEDSAEALGSSYKGKPCGSFGDAAVFAFYPNKQMTTGEGGVILTDNPKIEEMCRSMANQGRKVKNGKWLEHIRLGYNYRLSEIECVLGIAQLQRVKELLQKRSKVARMYDAKLRGIKGLELLKAGKEAKKSFFVYVVKLSRQYSRSQRGDIISRLAEKGIQCSTYFQTIHLQPFYRESFGYKKGDFPIAEGVSDRTIALPFYNNLKEKDMDFVVKALKESLSDLG
ncbi:MAG: DegT/DnrJ/EryC1/StrS family aminotransferase [Candidatus Wildermuthbacteria bacterium]|nr:DegT/DnrJ/EryC1/StrS family aminotransferase [Candidatus Wildermuthbacteria bacterium]